MLYARADGRNGNQKNCRVKGYIAAWFYKKSGDYIYHGKVEKDRVKGVIATNENRKHICCFFVKAQYQRQGIGRKLWNFLRENSSSKTITVNSSPYAVPVYHKLGFIDTDTEQLSDGIRYIPMKFEK